MNEGLAYWAPPDENPNFISRPPDPGLINLFKTVGWESLYHSPFYAAKRFSELTLESSSYFNVAGRLLDPEEANQKYGLGGQLKFDEPIKEEAAQLMHRRKMDEIDRAYLISSGQTTGMRKAASFGVGMAATLLDPVNFASMFIPVAGEARIARFASQFTGATTQRLVRGALTGAGGAAMVEPFILLPALQEQANYNLKDSAMNLGFGAALGGFLHAGLGAVVDRIKRMQPKDADAIFEAAMNNVLKDEPVTSPAKVAEFVDELNVTSKAVPFDYSYTAGGVAKFNLEGEVVGITHSMEKADSAKASDPSSPVTTLELRTANGKTETIFFGGHLDKELLGTKLTVGAGTDIFDRLFAVTAKSVEEANPRPALTINDIPTRDANGRFLSKEKRLELLDKKIREEQLAKQDNGPQKVIKDTKEISHRQPIDDLGITGESAKDTQIIESDIAEVERSLDLSPEEMTRLREEIKAETGDVAGREKGIAEGVKCMIRNLI